MIGAARVHDVDILVIGGGSAGCTAAIAAARTGARTLLIERHPFLGGTSTAVLDTFYGFYTPGDAPRKVVGGIADEVVDALRRLGPVIERPNTFGAGTGVTYHPEHLKVVWEQLAAEAGVELLLYATLVDATRDGRRIDEALLATTAGLRRVRARTWIDASGDATLFDRAGLAVELAGEHEPAQTLTTTFKLCNVDQEARRRVTKDEVHRLMEEAAESGEYDLPRREGSDHVTPVEGMTATIMTRLESTEQRAGVLRNAADPEVLTRAEVAGRRQALEYVRFLRDRVPGYERSRLSTFGTQIGVRETRRVEGRYRVTRDDVLAAREFPDEIGLCGAPLEDHHVGHDTAWTYIPGGRCVGIPFRALLARDADDVAVAGRCFSATHDAHTSIRSMAQCMAMGQAVGTAAGRAIGAGGTVAATDVAELRRQLAADGAVLDRA